MKSISVDNQAALAARRLLPRDFLWIIARDRTTGDPVSVGFWSDITSVSALIKNPDTGAPNLRDFYGAGGLIQISDIPAVATVTVQRVTIKLSQLDDQVEQAVRLYDVKQARVEIYTGLLDPDSRKLIDPAECQFVGFIDEVRIETPAEGDAGGVTLTCVSHTQELARANPAKRSQADQRTRSASDDFFIDAAVCGEWQHFWGEAQGKTEAVKPQGLFGWGGFLGIF